MKRKIYILSIIIILFSSIILFVSMRNNIVINIKERGFYNVYFYNVNTEEKIDFGKKLNLFGKISIDDKKIYSKKNIENQYLIVVESEEYIGLTTYTIFNYEEKIINL